MLEICHFKLVFPLYRFIETYEFYIEFQHRSFHSEFDIKLYIGRQFISWTVNGVRCLSTLSVHVRVTAMNIIVVIYQLSSHKRCSNEIISVLQMPRNRIIRIQRTIPCRIRNCQYISENQITPVLFVNPKSQFIDSSDSVNLTISLHTTTKINMRI